MKIAAYNVENLFDRAKVFNEKETIAQQVLDDSSRLNSLFENEEYTSDNKKEMKKLFKRLGLEKSDKGPYVILRKIRGKIVARPKNKPIKIIADGRLDWIGFLEHRPAPINEIAIQNTGRVLRDVNADIVAVVEAESRTSLKQFSDYILEKVNGKPYDNVMLIDGNDDRGIDVGIMTRKDYNIGLMQSHIFDKSTPRSRSFIFSRDCPEYCVTTPQGEKVWVLPNHFKSKYGGDDSRSKKRREGQAQRTAEIYEELRKQGYENIVVLGDLNDTPDSKPLMPLLSGTDLKDVSEHASFDTGDFAGKGTYGLGNDSNKLDYLLLSPALYARVKKSGLFRKGAWPGSRPKRWEVYPELKKKIHVGSDHHVIWCEIE